jgi:hypothetical protein
MVIDPDSRKSAPHVWCRFCGAWAKIEDKETPFVGKTERTWEARTPTIDENIVPKLVDDLGARRSFFLKRGLTEETIRRYKLGYHEEYRRYAIPCYHKGMLYGIKYRIEPMAEEQLKSRQEKYAKYISEKGGVNNVIYNDGVLKGSPPYVLIDEGELDSLLLTQHGFPTICPFSGNNSRVAWRPEWRPLVRSVPQIYIIAQNDEPGELIAIARQHDIGRGVIVHPPQGYKDIGEWLRTIPELHRQRELVNLLRLTPVENVYGDTNHHHGES